MHTVQLLVCSVSAAQPCALVVRLRESVLLLLVPKALLLCSVMLVLGAVERPVWLLVSTARLSSGGLGVLRKPFYFIDNECQEEYVDIPTSSYVLCALFLHE